MTIADGKLELRTVKLKHVYNFLRENRQMKKNPHFNLFFYQERSMQPYFIIHYDGVKIDHYEK
jgi:hypothetical protein